MVMVLDFIMGCAVGAGVVGSSVQRTIAVDHADLKGAIWGSLINSLTYFLSIKWIAHDNNWAYCGTAVGSTAIVVYMTLKNRKEDVNGRGNGT